VDLCALALVLVVGQSCPWPGAAMHAMGIGKPSLIMDNFCALRTNNVKLNTLHVIQQDRYMESTRHVGLVKENAKRAAP